MTVRHPKKFHILGRTYQEHLAGLVVLTMLGMALASIISFLLLEPRYEASSRFVVQPKTEEMNGKVDEESREGLLETYKELLETPAVLDGVAQQEKIINNPEDLKKHMTIKQTGSSYVLNLKVWARLPGQAETWNEELLASFSSVVGKVFPNTQVNILAKPTGSATLIRPRPVWDVLLGAGVGLLCGLLYYGVRAWRDQTVRSEEFVTALGWDLLGVLPEMSAKEVKQSRFKQRNIEERRQRKRV